MEGCFMFQWGGGGVFFRLGGWGASVLSGGFTLLGDIGIDEGFSEKS